MDSVLISLPIGFRICFQGTAGKVRYYTRAWGSGYSLALQHRELIMETETAMPVPLRWTLRAGSLLLLLLSLAIFAGHWPWLTPLAFLVPLSLFAGWGLWVAGAGCAVFLAATLSLGLSSELGMARHQFVPMLILATGLAAVFVYLREYKAAQLAPLRRTDSLTLASIRDYLDSDLNREIRRGEREGTPVTVAVLHLDAPETPLPEQDQSNLMVRLGRLLHRTLRDFDSYYRNNETGFIIVLPATATPDSVRTIEGIRSQAKDMLTREGMELTLSAGVVGANVGDDARSLSEKAQETLRRAQKQGGNRTLTWTDAGGTGHD
ncbi:diguanylate cyclase [Halomonas sp. 22501_18_FS]|uniref:Diguanylate cyclase n=2 Tax=Oceanospirillales TaxID=135619 RepID=A0A9X4YBC5_9GAMM|nr:diguanylate cyclase [Halomonas utahensis]MYL73968.1 diguanylate cyclase [Halomonas sp. 22501_18_FS]